MSIAKRIALSEHWCRQRHTEGLGGASSIFLGPTPFPPLSTACALTGASCCRLNSDSRRLLRAPSSCDFIANSRYVVLHQLQPRAPCLDGMTFTGRPFIEFFVMMIARSDKLQRQRANTTECSQCSDLCRKKVRVMVCAGHRREKAS